jgi:hypothetical protein
MDKCLDSRGLNRVLSLIVDNASFHDVWVDCLKRRLLSWGNLVMNGNYFHMCWCVHVLNLIVKDGLPDIDNSVSRTCHAVWYARSSTTKLVKFVALLVRALTLVGLDIYNISSCTETWEDLWRIKFSRSKVCEWVHQEGKRCPDAKQL